MWFWSVSWSTNCPVFFSYFLVDQKKNCPVSGNFWAVSGKKKFGQPKKVLVYQKEIWLTKNSQRLTKNSLRLDNFFWSTKKNEKKTGQLVNQETDQNHMDGTNIDLHQAQTFTTKQFKIQILRTELAVPCGQVL